MKKSSLLSTCVLAGTLLLQMVALCIHARGAAGDVDLSFDPGSGLNGPVRAIALQPDGKMIIGGGYISMVKGHVCQNIARLNADGSGDESFAYAGPLTGVATIHAVALQSDGKVLAAHDNGLTRFNSDGSLDTSFILPSLVDYDLFSVGLLSLAVQPDDKILIGGAFTIVNGTLQGRVARLNADGSLDSSFHYDFGIDSPFPGVFSIVVQSDGKVLIGGQYITWAGGEVVRLNADGSLDNTFEPVAHEGSLVRSIALQPDGKVLIAGTFYTGPGPPPINCARLHADGSEDGTFDPGTGTQGGPGIYSVALQTDGKVLIGGYFTTVNGANRSRIARLNADGSVDGTFDPGPGPRPDIFAMVVQPNGKVLAGGVDLQGSGSMANYNLLTRLHTDGSRDGTFIAGGGVEGAVRTIAVQPDGKVLIGAGYINGINCRGLGRLNPDGSLDHSFDPDIAALGIPGVNSLGALQPDGKVLVGGSFISVDGIDHNRIARLNSDGSVDSSFIPGPGLDGGSVRLFALQPDGKILCAGTYYLGNDEYIFGVFRLNPNGSFDSSFVALRLRFPSETIFINAIAAQPDGKVLVAGFFTMDGGTNHNAIVRLNAGGGLDSAFDSVTGTGANSSVASMALQPDGKILISGCCFRDSGGSSQGLIARLNADGSLDSTFHADRAHVPGPGVGSVGSMALQPDGKVLCAGEYYWGNDSYTQRVYRLNTDGSLDSSFDPGSGGWPGGGGVDGTVNSIALQPDGNILICGNFLTIDGVARPHIARLYGDSRPPVSFAAWASSFGLSAAAASPDSDSDRDGLPNAVEYVLGGNPAVPDTSGRPEVTLSGGNIVFIFSRDDDSESPGVTLTVQSGTDLVNWPAVFHIGSNATSSSPGVSISENAAAPDTISVTIPRAGNDRMFARLQVAISP